MVRLTPPIEAAGITTCPRSIITASIPSFGFFTRLSLLVVVGWRRRNGLAILPRWWLSKLTSRWWGVWSEWRLSTSMIRVPWLLAGVVYIGGRWWCSSTIVVVVRLLPSHMRWRKRGWSSCWWWWQNSSPRWWRRFPDANTSSSSWSRRGWRE